MRLFLAAILCAATLAAVACGSSSKSDDKPASNPSPSVAAATTAPSTSNSAAPTATKPATVGSPAATTAMSSTSASSANTAGLDPCKLFTKEDAAATLGKAVADGKLNASETSPLGQKTCFYATDPSGGGNVQLSLITSAGMTDAVKKNGQNAKVQFGQEKALVPGVTTVTGVGEDAFIRGNTLYVLKGDVEFNIMLSGVGSNGDATQQTALKAAAAKVLPKLP